MNYWNDFESKKVSNRKKVSFTKLAEKIMKFFNTISILKLFRQFLVDFFLSMQIKIIITNEIDINHLKEEINVYKFAPKN